MNTSETTIPPPTTTTAANTSTGGQLESCPWMRTGTISVTGGPVVEPHRPRRRAREQQRRPSTTTRPTRRREPPEDTATRPTQRHRRHCTIRAGREPKMTEAVAAPERSPSHRDAPPGDGAARRWRGVARARRLRQRPRPDRRAAVHASSSRRTIELKVWFATAARGARGRAGAARAAALRQDHGAPPGAGVAGRRPSPRRDARVRADPARRLPVPLGARLPVDRYARAGALAARLLLLRDLRREGARGPGPRSPGPDAAGRRAVSCSPRSSAIWLTSAVWFFTSRPPGFRLF